MSNREYNDRNEYNDKRQLLYMVETRGECLYTCEICPLTIAKDVACTPGYRYKLSKEKLYLLYPDECFDLVL